MVISHDVSHHDTLCTQEYTQKVQIQGGITSLKIAKAIAYAININPD